MPIARTAQIDDDGTGMTGTVWNNAWKTQLYDQIDAAIAGESIVGTWTPTDASGGGLTFTTVFGSKYCRIGELVWVYLDVTFPATANANATAIGGLPFANISEQAGLAVGFTDIGVLPMVLVAASVPTINLFTSAGAVYSNSSWSGKSLRAAGCYRAA